mmetsp:Transcript_16999/g.18926  ORF Transcript_16999/g.18926 Transcript_16999/m.18926 type:complete len:753 (+) Transcript_16999:55-2313(+)
MTNHEPDFALSAEVFAHDKDARAVTDLGWPQGGVCSVSRDNTIQLLTKDDSNTLKSVVMLPGHEGSSMGVSSVMRVPPGKCATFPEGALVTGGYDNSVVIWANPTPSMNATQVQKYVGHSSSVTSLSMTNTGYVISGSVDKTVRVWKSASEVMELKGHEHIVWAVLGLDNGDIVSGSADRSIVIWHQGNIKKRITEHTDAVRGLANVPGVGFLSCSNDCTVRLWTYDGLCMRNLSGHAGFIYCVSVLSTGEFLSCAEDGTCKVWKDTACVQTLQHPCGIWGVVGLENGDICTGSQDGAVRLWTRSKDRMASDESIAQYNQKLLEIAAARSQAKGGSVGDLNVDSLPGPEALDVPGDKEGKILMLRNAQGQPELYVWKMAERRWNKEGDIVNAVEQGNTIRGKQYDYVFNVEMEGFKRKIGFNNGENPYAAATRFCTENDLPEEFIDQIVTFIIQNTPQQQPAYDPYNPSRYTGYTGATAQAPIRPKKPVHYFPQLTALTFPAAKLDAVHKKLVQLNAEAGAMALSTPEADIVNGLFQKLAKKQVSLEPQEVAVLKKLLEWPSNKRFPGIDICRLLALHENVAQLVVNSIGNDSADIFNWIAAAGVKSDFAACQMLGFRFFVNLFKCSATAQALLSNAESLLECAADCVSASNRNLRLAVTTLLLNFSVLFLKHPSDIKVQCLAIVVEVLQSESDPEIIFRALVALGTLLHNDEETSSLTTDLGVPDILNKHAKSSTSKVAACTKSLKSTYNK